VKERILLAEDNEDMAALLGHILQVLGYEVTVARRGPEAVEMAASQPPDLIIIDDILIPKMDGFQAVSRLLENPKTRLIPILAVSVKDMPEDREECLMSGCDGFIAKPFTRKELQSAVETMLKNVRQGTGPGGPHVPNIS
jgi:CheY-like chemotaxis protein